MKRALLIGIGTLATVGAVGLLYTSTLAASAFSTLTDNFDDNSINATTWGTYQPGTSTVTETSQQIQFAPQASTVDTQALLYSNASYDLTNDSVRANFIQGCSGSIDNVMFLYLDANNAVKFIWNGGTLYADKVVAGVETTPASASVTLGANTWIRFREASGTLYWEYSTNNQSSWTTLYSVADPFSMTTLQLNLQAYEWGSTASPGTMIFDNVNYTPSVASPAVNTSQSVIFFSTD